MVMDSIVGKLRPLYNSCIFLILILLLLIQSAHADIHFGLGGGYNAFLGGKPSGYDIEEYHIAYPALLLEAAYKYDNKPITMGLMIELIPVYDMTYSIAYSNGIMKYNKRATIIPFLFYLQRNFGIINLSDFIGCSFYGAGGLGISLNNLIIADSSSTSLKPALMLGGGVQFDIWIFSLDWGLIFNMTSAEDALRNQSESIKTIGAKSTLSVNF